MSATVPDFDHPMWQAIVGLLAGYGIILAIIFVLFFVVPWLLFM